MPGGFFESVITGAKQAIGYAQRAVRTGLERVKAFGEFIEGGGDIPQEEFIGLYDDYETAKSIWEEMKGLGQYEEIAGNYAQATNFDYFQRHIMKMKIQAIDAETGEEIVHWITVESDNELTFEEWEQSARESVTESIGGYSWEIGEFLDYEYYQRSW